tara:strand:- start:26 stop:484 length:459 start_codon:yes stop_codon:yes gene_type:complete
MLIKNYPNYDITIEGIVLNIKKNKPIKYQLDKDGYKTCKLYNNGTYKICKLHRLLALHFIPLQEGKIFVDHINRDKSDNNILNLRWVNKSENNSNRNAYINSKLKERYISITTDKKYYKLTMRKPYNFIKSYKISEYSLNDIIKIRDNIINA